MWATDYRTSKLFVGRLKVIVRSLLQWANHGTLNIIAALIAVRNWVASHILNAVGNPFANKTISIYFLQDVPIVTALFVM